MNDLSVKILLIEDNPVEVLVMKALLAKAEKAAIQHTLFELVSANTLAEGLERLGEGDFNLILLDLSLPDSEGLETLAAVTRHGQQVPIVVLTWLADESLAVEALRLGAQDYMVKGQQDPYTVVRAIRYAIERHRLLQSQSLIDELTGLYNLRGFRIVAEQHWKLASRTGKDFLLLYADLDGLKRVNDNFGHVAGSELLCRTADVLRNTFRTSDIIARVGGDEFVCLLTNFEDLTEEIVVARLNENLERYNASTPTKVSFSIGLSRFNHERPLTLDELIANADQLMYANKRQKKSSKLALTV